MFKVLSIGREKRCRVLPRQGRANLTGISIAEAARLSDGSCVMVSLAKSTLSPLLLKRYS
jgi:hypothetical protein